MRMTELRPVQCCVTTLPALRATTALTVLLFLRQKEMFHVMILLRQLAMFVEGVIGMMDWIASFMPAGFHALHIAHAACPPAEVSSICTILISLQGSS